MTDQTLRQALDAELARQRRNTTTYKRSVIRGTADYGAVEAESLLSELRQISMAAARSDKPETERMHTARLAAHAALAKIQDALYNLGNEIDRLGV